MKKKFFKFTLSIFFSCTFLFGLISCEESQSDDLTNTVNKNGSIETSVTVQPVDSSHDVLVTKHIVWHNNIEWKTIETHDTIPALGVDLKDNEGTFEVTRKDYEIYITVK